MKKTKFLWILGIAGFIIGSAGFLDRIIFGLESHNTGSYISWGLLIAGYIYFIGLSAGAFLLSCLVYVFNIKKLERIARFSLFTALICMLMAMFSIFFDLGHPYRSLIKLFLNAHLGSMMGWMVFLYTSYFILMTAELIIASWNNFHLGRLKAPFMLGVLGAVGIPLAIAFHGGVGAIFAVVKAKPYWNTGLFPVMFVIEALLSGGALITLLTYFFVPGRGTKEHTDLVITLGRIVFGLLALYVILFLSEALVALYGRVPRHTESYRFMMFGQYAPVFWIGQVFLAVFAPAVFFLLGRKSPKAAAVASGLIVIGFIAVRINIVIPAEVVPEFEGLRTAFCDSRLGFVYFPSLMEWLFEMWIVSFGLILFLAGNKLLPLFREGRDNG